MIKNLIKCEATTEFYQLQLENFEEGSKLSEECSETIEVSKYHEIFYQNVLNEL